MIKPSLSFAGLPEEAVVALSVDVSEYGTLSQVSGDEVKEVQLQGAREVLFEFTSGPRPDAVDDEELLPPPEEVEEAVEDESYKLRVKDEL